MIELFLRAGLESTRIMKYIAGIRLEEELFVDVMISTLN
jgi:hypothetical protein